MRSVQQSDQNGDSLHKHNYLIKTVCSIQWLFSHFLQLSSFLSTTVAECLQSYAPSESSAMNCTYPPTTKPSKQSTHSNCKPITRNMLTRSPLFFLRSSSPSLRLGHHCRHCGSLHSWVSCYNFSCSLICWCVVILFSMRLHQSVVFSVQRLCMIFLCFP